MKVKIKTKVLNVRVSEEEFTAAKSAAKIECQCASEFVRLLLRADLRVKGLWPPPAPVNSEGAR